MSKRDRTTLKSFFSNGALPAAEEYRDLIDSSVNQVEDGFDKSEIDGLKLNSVGGSLRVMSLYQGLGTPEASWYFDHGNANRGALHIRPGPGKDAHLITDADKRAAKNDHDAGLSIDSKGRVGIGQQTPVWPLDVAGITRSHGRIGVESENIPNVPADGKWHDITQPMTGCQVFEVVAGAGGLEGQGRYTLVYAIAMNAYHPGNRLMNWFFKRRKIRTQTAMYGSYADRLRLRWVKDKRQQYHYKMQIRTNAKFGAGRTIQYSLTRLWFDSVMSGSRPDGKGRDDALL